MGVIPDQFGCSRPLHTGGKVGLGRFTLIRRLGLGGMGEVWLAWDDQLQEIRPRPDTTTPKWIRLFPDGGLSGWQSTPGSDWGWDNGAVTSQAAIGYLYSPEFVTNVQFKADVKYGPGANGGLFFRAYLTGDTRKLYQVAGYEAQIGGDRDSPGARTGSLYGFANLRTTSIRPNTWFTLHVVAIGNRIMILVNDRVVVEYADSKKMYRYGRLALQQISRNPASGITCRNVMYQPLPEDETRAWQAARADIPH